MDMPRPEPRHKRSGDRSGEGRGDFYRGHKTMNFWQKTEWEREPMAYRKGRFDWVCGLTWLLAAMMAIAFGLGIAGIVFGVLGV